MAPIRSLNVATPKLAYLKYASTPRLPTSPTTISQNPRGVRGPAASISRATVKVNTVTPTSSARKSIRHQA